MPCDKKVRREIDSLDAKIIAVCYLVAALCFLGYVGICLYERMGGV